VFGADKTYFGYYEGNYSLKIGHPIGIYLFKVSDLGISLVCITHTEASVEFKGISNSSIKPAQ
jgi:hypothetical protein